MFADCRSKLESGKPRKSDARSPPPKGGAGYRDRALLRLIREEYNGQTSAGLEKDRSKEKDTWGGKLEAKAEPAPTGLMAKAAAAVSSAVVRCPPSQVCLHLPFQRTSHNSLTFSPLWAHRNGRLTVRTVVVRAHQSRKYL